MLIASSIFLSIICAALYRMGGMGKPFNRYYRRLGVPAVVLLTLVLLRHSLPWWVYLSVFVLQFGAVSTYFKWGGEKDVQWYNWLLVGFFNGLVFLPAALATGHLTWLVFRTIFLMSTITAISETSENVWVEECGRGFLICSSVLLLLINC